MLGEKPVPLPLCLQQISPGLVLGLNLGVCSQRPATNCESHGINGKILFVIGNFTFLRTLLYHKMGVSFLSVLPKLCSFILPVAYMIKTLSVWQLWITEMIHIALLPCVLNS
jgi:hypothetical protein